MQEVLKIKKQQAPEVNLTGEKFSNDLSAISHLENGKIAFVDYLLPGETALCRAYRARKDFVNTRVLELLTASRDRVEPRCSHFGLCGGCRLQHLRWDQHASVKEGLFTETLTRQFKLDVPFEPIAPAVSQWHYRNKMEYTVFPGEFEFIPELGPEQVRETGHIGAGFFKRGSHFRLIDLEECYLGHPRGLEILSAVKEWAKEMGVPAYNLKDHLGTLRNVVVRSSDASGELMLNIVVSDLRALTAEAVESLEATLAAFEPASVFLTSNKSLSTAYVPEDQVLLSGRDHITETLLGVRFSITPNTFFQTNTTMAEELFGHVKSLLELNKDDVVIDAFCGTGTVALMLAGSAAHVVGIDEVEDSIERASENADVNEIRNAEFIFGKVEDRIDEVLQKHRPRVLVVDPPRVGLHPSALKTICGSRTEKLIYVSCNPATLGRDLSGLIDAGYKVISVKPFDMFPNTPHVESVTALELA